MLPVYKNCVSTSSGRPAQDFNFENSSVNSSLNAININACNVTSGAMSVVSLVCGQGKFDSIIVDDLIFNGTLNVVIPTNSNSTYQSVARWDHNNLLNDSLVFIDDAGLLTGPNALFTGTITCGSIELGTGSAALPALHFSSDTTTGLYRVGVDEIGMSVGGDLMTMWASTGMLLYTQTPPTSTTQLTISSTIQNSARVVLSGQEFYQAANTSNDGVALLIGINSANNRQLLLADSANLTQNTTNPTLRFNVNGGWIDAVATDITTALPLTIGNKSTNTTVLGSSLTLAGPIKFNLNLNKMFTDSHKAANLPSGTYTTVASYSGSSGVLKKIWLALNGADPGLCYINITFDGAASPQFGTNIVTGFDSSNSLACDIVFSAGFHAASYWMTDVSGSNMNSFAQLGGYLAIDMPFSSSFSVKIFNNTGIGMNFWSQAFFTKQELNTSLRLYAKPYKYLFPTSTLTTFRECPILSVSSPNGVFLKGVKMLIDGGGDMFWMEGKVRIYNGGPGMTVGTSQTYFAPTPSDLSYYIQQAPTPTLICQSSGTEDYFLTSYSFNSFPLYSTNCSGTVHNSTSSAAGNLTLYKYYDVSSEVFTAPGASVNTTFVVTFTIGDQTTPPPISTSVSFNIGVVYYYA